MVSLIKILMLNEYKNLIQCFQSKSQAIMLLALIGKLSFWVLHLKIIVVVL